MVKTEKWPLTIVLSTIGLQVHLDFNLRRLAVWNALLRYMRDKQRGERERESSNEGGYHFIASISAHVFSPNYNMAASICHHSILWLTDDPNCSRWDILRAAARREWLATPWREWAAAPRAVSIQGLIC